MAEKKEKQYVSDNAQLMAEWDWEKNDAENLDPHHISYGSRQKAWWLCPKGHSYDARISNKALLNKGCPICSGRVAIPGVNDLYTLNPDLVKEWHP